MQLRPVSTHKEFPMSTALYLTMVFAGSHECPPGYPVYYSYRPAVVYDSTAGYPAYGPTTSYDPATYGVPHTAGYRGPQAAPSRRTAIVNMTSHAGFQPAHITINVGESVEWRNVSPDVHTATANPDLASNPAHVVLPEGAEPFHSEDLPPGSRYAYTFSVPGTYFYVCLPHEKKGMVGIVHVMGADGAAHGAPSASSAPTASGAPGTDGAPATGGVPPAGSDY
jgi:plastocyanin